MQSYSKPPMISNNHFCKEAGEYLEAHGFIRTDDHRNQMIQYRSECFRVVVYGDSADFTKRDASGHYALLSTRTQIDRYKIFDWMLVFHADGVVPLRSFIHQVMKEGVVFSAEEVLKGVFQHFQVTDDREAVPVNY